MEHGAAPWLMEDGFRNWTQASVTQAPIFLAPRPCFQRPCLCVKRDWFLKPEVTQEQKNQSCHSFVIFQQSSQAAQWHTWSVPRTTDQFNKENGNKIKPPNQRPTFFDWVNCFFCRIQESYGGPVLRSIRAQGSLTVHWVLRLCSSWQLVLRGWTGLDWSGEADEAQGWGASASYLCRVAPSAPFPPVPLQHFNRTIHPTSFTSSGPFPEEAQVSHLHWVTPLRKIYFNQEKCLR